MAAERYRRFYAPGMTKKKGAEGFCGISAGSLFQQISGAARRMERAGLPRRCAPRNDEFFRWTSLPRLAGERVPERRERVSNHTERSDAVFFAVGRGQASRSFFPFLSSVASLRMEGTGLPRRFAPRNDEVGRLS
jgi:hypothetical protein